MSEETNVTESNESGWSGIKKTIVGTVGTVVAAGGMWVSTHLFGGSTEEKEAPKTEQATPAPVIVNLNNNNTNQQKQGGGTTTIIKEKVVEKQTEKPAEKKKSETEDAPW
jgi:hypothetical protein